MTLMKSFKKENALVIYSLLVGYILLVIRNAWVSDDGMITFRVIENHLAGYGLGYNPYVRVQVFTHPLWMFFISFIYYVQRLFVSSGPNALYYITIFLSVLLSLLTMYLLLTRIAQPRLLALAFASLTLTLSSGYIDFSTSGLENPLTHFLIVLFVIAYLKETPTLMELALITALIMLNRIDAVILTAPALMFAWWNSSQRKKDIRNILLGFLPFFLWELFSLLYFGFLFPNTAYAKLNTGISDVALAEQGLDYLLNSINWDPIILFVIGFAAVSLFANANPKLAFLFSGTVFYLIYIVKIGGDFMSGRFLTAPLLLSTAIIAYHLKIKQSQSFGIGIVILLGAFSLRSPLLSSNMVLYLPSYPIGDNNGISDQRLYYFGNPVEGQYNSLVENGFRGSIFGSEFAGEKWYYTKSRKVFIADALGKIGYQKGPNIYVIDNYALSDPLLVRLPVLNKEWQIGHFRRDLPEGYFETLESGENKIEDPDLALYFSKLQIITTGNLSDWSRLVEIWKFNTGQYDALLQHYVSRSVK